GTDSRHEGGAGSGGAGGAAGASGAAGVGGGVGGFTVEDASGSGDGLLTCAADSITPTLIPLDLYVMMDSSSSMQETTTTGSTKWTAIRDAMSAFLNDPQSAGIGVGIGYFPVPNPGVPAQCTSNADCGAFGPCQLKVCNMAKVQFCQE